MIKMTIKELQQKLEKLGYFIKLDNDIYVYAKSGKQVCRILKGKHLPTYYQALAESTRETIKQFAKTF